MAADIRASREKAPELFLWQPGREVIEVNLKEALGVGTGLYWDSSSQPFGYWGKKMINRCVFPFPNISLLNCKVASCLFWSTICPTFQAQLIAHFLCHYESMIYLTNFHTANKPTFVPPGGQFPNIAAQPGTAAAVGTRAVVKTMSGASHFREEKVKLCE